jgi:hypothetical protein
LRKEYFACWFRLDYVDRYLIWITTEPETVLLDREGLIAIFQSEVSLAKYAQVKGIELVNEQPQLHHLDSVVEWSQKPANPIDCQQCLATWNLYLDVAHSVQCSFSGDQKGTVRNRIYDKLFYGNNIYGLTPDGEYYIPQWTALERRTLAEILMDGEAIFRQHLGETKH